MSDVGRFLRRARPFDFVEGAPQPGRYPPDGLGILESIEAIRFAPVEIGYGFDAEGRQVFRQVGTEDLISRMTERDLATIQEGTFVHNHPPYFMFGEGDPRRRAGSFSLLDLVFMYEHRLVELVAVTHERTYFLRQWEEGFFLDPGQLTSAYNEFLQETQKRLLGLAGRGIISNQDAESEGRIADEVMQQLSIYFRYSWEVRHHAPGSR